MRASSSALWDGKGEARRSTGCKLYTECDGGGCSCCFSGSSSEVKLNHFVDRKKDPGSVMDWFQMLVVGSATSSTSLQMVIVNHGSLGPGDGTGLEVGSFSVHHEVSLEIVIRVVALNFGWHDLVEVALFHFNSINPDLSSMSDVMNDPQEFFLGSCCPLPSS